MTETVGGPVNTRTPESLRLAVEGSISSVGAPGCTVALVDASGLRWTDAFGFADLRSRRRATPATVYRLFSGTKLFTAVAVLHLVEQGVLSLDDAVQRHLPELKVAGRITLRDLLSHQSGLKDTLGGFLAVTSTPDKPPTSGAALARYRIVSARPPGRKVEYRNVNYALLGEVITRVSGVEYRDYVSRYVLDPLGMQAAWALSEDQRCEAATGYIGRWDPMRLVLRALFPDLPERLYGGRIGSLIELREFDLATSAIGGLVGTMPEFAKFLQEQLASGGAVLRQESTLLMQTRAAEGKAGIESKVGVGLGWKIGQVDGRRFLNHEGGGAGFTSELRLYPDAGIGIALAMNAMRMPVTMRTAHRICEAVFENQAELG